TSAGARRAAPATRDARTSGADARGLGGSGGRSDRFGERLEVGGALRAPQEVAEERGVRALALVRGDPGEVEQRLHRLVVELELLRRQARRLGERVPGVREPRVHEADANPA